MSFKKPSFCFYCRIWPNTSACVPGGGGQLCLPSGKLGVQGGPGWGGRVLRTAPRPRQAASQTCKQPALCSGRVCRWKGPHVLRGAADPQQESSCASIHTPWRMGSVSQPLQHKHLPHRAARGGKKNKRNLASVGLSSTELPFSEFRFLCLSRVQ